MKGIIESNKGQDYCAFQSSENTYNLVIGSLTYEDGIIYGTGTIYTYYYGYNQYSISKGGFDGNVTITSEKNYAFSNTSTQTPRFQGVEVVSFVEVSFLFSIIFVYILFRDFTMRKRRRRSSGRR
jgi:hypothetical protein